jgi:Flp pilus assembly protein TadG
MTRPTHTRLSAPLLPDQKRWSEHRPGTGPQPRRHRSRGRPVTRPATSLAARLTGDRGTVTVEMLLIGFPLALVMLAFATLVIRLGSAHIDVGNAAAAAARAASLERTADQATAAARQAATADLTTGDSSCRQVTVTVDNANFRAGGTVTVAVACTVNLADLPMGGLTANRRLTATSTSPIDTYRGATP